MLSCVVFNGVLFRSGFLVAETLCGRAGIDPEKYFLYVYVVWIYICMMNTEHTEAGQEFSVSADVR